MLALKQFNEYPNGTARQKLQDAWIQLQETSVVVCGKYQIQHAETAWPGPDAYDGEDLDDLVEATATWLREKLPLLREYETTNHRQPERSVFLF